MSILSVRVPARPAYLRCFKVVIAVGGSLPASMRAVCDIRHESSSRPGRVSPRRREASVPANACKELLEIAELALQERERGDGRSLGTQHARADAHRLETGCHGGLLLRFCQSSLRADEYRDRAHQAWQVGERCR